MSAPPYLRRIGALLALAALVALPCPFATLTGRPCPGCGLGRATLALAHGSLSEAVSLHPLSPLVVPLVVGFTAYGAAAYLVRGRWPGLEGRVADRVALVGIALWVALLAVWLARFQGLLGGPVPV